MATAAVRPAVADDVDKIVRIQAETWRTAYAELVPTAAIDQLTSLPARQAWAAAVTAGDGYHVLLATEGDRAVGFCAAALAAETPPGGAVDESGREPTARRPPAPKPSDRGVTGEPGRDEPGARSSGAPDDPPEVGARHWAEIGALLVEPRWGRRGHGGRLLAAAAGALRTAGAIYGLAWIPETDQASRRFYARAGWGSDGQLRVLDAGDRELREIRITGSLDLKLQ
ncbi:MAG: GNAT family N-acetyltransferase [Pseudonocardia sp.]